MNQPSSIIQHFREWPRAFQWLTYAIAFITLFLIWNSLIRPASWALEAEAQKVEEKVAAVRNSEQLAEELRRQRDVIVNIGRVIAPRSDSEGRDALTRAYHEVVLNEDYRSVRNEEFNTKSVGRIPDTISAQIIGTGNKLARLNMDVRFEASPEDTIDIIRAFEQREDIESISEVSINRSGRGRLKVRLNLEAWVEVASNTA